MSLTPSRIIKSTISSRYIPFCLSNNFSMILRVSSVYQYYNPLRTEYFGRNRRNLHFLWFPNKGLERELEIRTLWKQQSSIQQQQRDTESVLYLLCFSCIYHWIYMHTALVYFLYMSDVCPCWSCYIILCRPAGYSSWVTTPRCTRRHHYG